MRLGGRGKPGPKKDKAIEVDSHTTRHIVNHKKWLALIKTNAEPNSFTH